MPLHETRIDNYEHISKYKTSTCCADGDTDQGDGVRDRMGEQPGRVSLPFELLGLWMSDPPLNMNFGMRILVVTCRLSTVVGEGTGACVHERLFLLNIDAQMTPGRT